MSIFFIYFVYLYNFCIYFLYVFHKGFLIEVSVDVHGETRLKPRNSDDFQRYPQSAYAQYASIVCLENHRNYLRLRSVSREETNLSLF